MKSFQLSHIMYMVKSNAINAIKDKITQEIKHPINLEDCTDMPYISMIDKFNDICEYTASSAEVINGKLVLSMWIKGYEGDDNSLCTEEEPFVNMVGSENILINILEVAEELARKKLKHYEYKMWNNY